MKKYYKNDQNQIAVLDTDNPDAGWVILSDPESKAVINAVNTGTMGSVGAGAQRALTQFDKGVMEMFGKPREPDAAAELQWDITQERSPIATAIGESAPYMAVGGPLGAVGRGAGILGNAALQGGGAAIIAGLMPGSPKERAQNAAVAGGLALAGEGLLGGGAAAYRALRGIGQATPTPPVAGSAGDDLIAAAEKFGVPVIHADVNPPSNAMANLIRTSDPMVNAREAQSAALEQALKGLGDTTLSIGTDRVPLAAKQLLDTDKAIAKELYDKVEALAPTAPVVPTANTQAALERALERATASVVPDRPLISTLTRARDKIAGMGGNATYSAMRDLRSDLGSRLADMKRGLGSPVGSVASRDLGQVRDAVTKDLTDYTRSSGNSELAKAAGTADHWYRTTVAQTKDPNSQIRKLIMAEGPDADRKVSEWLKGAGDNRYGSVDDFLKEKPPAGVSQELLNMREIDVDSVRDTLYKAIIENTAAGSRTSSGTFSPQMLANQQRHVVTGSPLAPKDLKDLISLSKDLAPSITRTGGPDPLTGVQLVDQLSNALSGVAGSGITAGVGSLVGGGAGGLVGGLVGGLAGAGVKNIIANRVANHYARTAVRAVDNAGGGGVPPPAQRGTAGAFSRAMAIQGAPAIMTPQWQKDLALTDEKERREEINRQHVGDNAYDQVSTAVDAATDPDGRVDPLVLTAQLSEIPAAMWRQSGVTRVGATNSLMLADRLSLYLTPTRAMTAIGDPTAHWFAQHALDPTIGMAAQSQMVQSFTNTIMEA